jgi:hypothetical protein
MNLEIYYKNKARVKREDIAIDLVMKYNLNAEQVTELMEEIDKLIKYTLMEKVNDNS